MTTHVPSNEAIKSIAHDSNLSPIHSGNRQAWWMILTLAIVSLLPLGWTIQSAYLRLTQPNPQSPWEAEILADAYRASHHLPVYTLPHVGHATHMYGPLITYVCAPFVRARDFSMRPARWIAIASATSLALVASSALTRRRGWLMGVVAFCLLLTQFYRTRATIAEARPDAAAAALGALTIWLFYLSHTQRAIARAIGFLAAGIVVNLIGFGFKQTAAAVSIIPMLAVLFTRPVPLIRHLILAAIPPACMALAIASLHLSPAMYFYIVKGQTLFQFRWDAWPLDLINLLTTNILCDIAFVLWLLGICTAPVSRDAMAWLLVTIGVTSIASAAAVAKVGGQTNSYLTTFLAMAVFSILLLPDILNKAASLARSQSPRIRHVQITLVVFLSIVLLADATGVAGYRYWTTDVKAYGDANYKRIVRRVRTLRGQVICPDDPTILLHAKGRLERNLYCELDAQGWVGRPPYIVNELKEADYVILVHGVWTPTISPAALEKRGYKPVNDPAFKGTAYALYQRIKSRPTSKPATHKHDATTNREHPWHQASSPST